jgi:hypothetical protein
MRKRGHSNVRSEQTRDWSKIETRCARGVARIPLSGGASYESFHELPPLALHRDEWEEIGRRMGWLPEEKEQ